jgi:hypothetical protein
MVRNLLPRKFDQTNRRHNNKQKAYATDKQSKDCGLGGKMVNKKLELVFIDKDGKWYPLDEVGRETLAEGLEKMSKEVAKRLELLKEQR